MHILLIIEIAGQLYFTLHALQNGKPRYWPILIVLLPWIGFLSYLILEVLPASKTAPTEIGGVEAVPSPLIAGHSSSSDSSSTAAPEVVYLSMGKLFRKAGRQPADQIHSPFGQKIVDRTLEMNQKHEWKSKGAGAYFSGGALWGVEQVDADAVKVSITSVCRSPETHHLYYVLETDTAGGLFRQDMTSGEEMRLFHKENFRARDLGINAETGELVCAQHQPNGVADIAVADADGRNLRAVTQGDAVDEAPSWIPGTKRRLLFQSSGIARNAAGYAAGRGPSSIQALDLDDGRLTPVLENPRFDYLQPRIAEDGFMYYIRRPFETPKADPSAVLTDFILFPFRLLRAFFHYLNFFSLVYSKKPLTTASGPPAKGDEMKRIVLRGRVLDAEKALRRNGEGTPSLVPANWQLIRRGADHSEQTVASHVAAYDLLPGGGIVWTNGFGVYTLLPDGGRTLLTRDNLIETVIAA